jgi:hypothetical protein
MEQPLGGFFCNLRCTVSAPALPGVTAIEHVRAVE